jgi:hypothetical protein
VVRGGERLRTGQSITVVSGRGEGSAVKVARAD